jgi:hypothetical protein
LRHEVLGFGISFKNEGLEFKAWGRRMRDEGLGFEVQCGNEGLWFKAWGSGFKGSRCTGMQMGSCASRACIRVSDSALRLTFWSLDFAKIMFPPSG